MPILVTRGDEAATRRRPPRSREHRSRRPAWPSRRGWRRCRTPRRRSPRRGTARSRSRRRAETSRASTGGCRGWSARRRRSGPASSPAHIAGLSQGCSGRRGSDRRGGRRCRRPSSAGRCADRRIRAGGSPMAEAQGMVRADGSEEGLRRGCDSSCGRRRFPLDGPIHSPRCDPPAPFRLHPGSAG